MLVVREEKKLKQFINLTNVVRVKCAEKEIFFDLHNSRNAIEWSFESKEIAEQNYSLIIEDYESGIETCYIKEKYHKDIVIEHEGDELYD